MKHASSHAPVDSPQAMARVLAAMIATEEDGVRACELDMLEDVEGFRRLGLSRQAFQAIAKSYCDELGHRIGESGYLSLDDLQRVDELLQQVVDPDCRLLVASLTTSLMLADGHIREAERSLFEHLKMRWGLSRDDITRAILGAASVE